FPRKVRNFLGDVNWDIPCPTHEVIQEVVLVPLVGNPICRTVDGVADRTHTVASVRQHAGAWRSEEGGQPAGSIGGDARRDQFWQGHAIAAFRMAWRADRRDAMAVELLQSPALGEQRVAPILAASVG